ncbi:MAG: bifunctional [glutamate--ammonia ligase]-adenylyl-L-tyrosine phosphorylase/[glutamate--ammonia-ligase] adenylyltransferase [Nitrospiraceae bacterium]|nr:bifunctional [glutamate--ammonia ligase]-adenylyl-L-tyrosine phosphorylase/[glutamate--ammonia-ligase] adenylyltransferase [Nitrospiraceae bacterium]
MTNEFANVAFEDPQAAEQRLGAILTPEHPELTAHLADALAHCAGPGAALLGLDRFLEAAAEPDEERRRMAAESRYTHLLCTIFDQSQMLTDIVCRHPQYMQWLWEEADLENALPRERMIAEMYEWAAGCPTSEEGGLAMRRFRQREILRIAVRDIYCAASLVSLTEDLSNLADAALETATRITYPDLERRFGKPMWTDADGTLREAGFVVIGMGKLGGRELNFSSDIDLMFLFSADGETTGSSSSSDEASTISNLEFFQKLGERIIALVSLQTEEGFIFRVDMRLRPHGRMGSLATPLHSALDYYGRYAQCWERQAMIKARPVAGDLELGRCFIDETRPLVFPRYFDDETLEAIHQTKLQTEAQTAGRMETDIEVKLGRGGIRDIEFTVQMLQMLNGGRMPELRTVNNLQAIEALGRRAHLRPFEAAALASNYAFLRRVEHRLQIEGGQQLHVLPSGPAELDRFARRLGYASGASFMAEFRDRTQETRQILEQFLTVEGAGKLWTYDLLSMQSDGEIGKQHLARDYGFREPDRARAELLLLCAGPEEQPYAFHVRAQFAEIVTPLLEALADTGDPDATLMRLEGVLSNIRAPGAIYETMKSNASYCRYLVQLVSNSQYLSEIITRDPGLFDVLAAGDTLDMTVTRADLEEQLASLSGAYDSEAAPYRLRDGETLRVGLRELFREAPLEDVGRELTQLAEVCLDYSLDRARQDTQKRYGKASGPFTVLAVGKFGGGEMGYGSDLDVLFVYDVNATVDSGMATSEYYAAMASKTFNRLKEPTRYGSLYDIDSRLRPDGKKGTLVVSDRRLYEYYAEEAQPWERLAWMKVRAVAGDLAFGEQVAAQARQIAFALPLTPETLDQIDDVRQRLVKASSPLNLKKGEGGIAEIEFAVRLLQLRHANANPALRRGGVMGALDLLDQMGVFVSEEHDTLKSAYLLLRRIENRIRMWNGRSDSSLPEKPGDRAELARRLGIEGGLDEFVAMHRCGVHAVYLSILDRIRKDV